MVISIALMLGVHIIVPGLHQTLVFARIELLTYFQTGKHLWCGPGTVLCTPNISAMKISEKFNSGEHQVLVEARHMYVHA